MELIDVEILSRDKVRYVYDDGTTSIEDAEYIEPVQEPTQLDRVEANIDYLVLVNS